MTTSTDPDLAALGRVTAYLLSAVAAINDDQWALSTPCAEWDLAALVDHVTGGNWFTILTLAGNTTEEAMAATMRQFEDGSATPTQATQSLKDQLESFERVGVLDRSWHHVAGTLSGREMLRLRIHDLTVHSWDIEQTTQSPAVLPAELVQWGLAELHDGNSCTVRHFGIEGPPPPAAEEMTDYLGAFGRVL